MEPLMMEALGLLSKKTKKKESDISKVKKKITEKTETKKKSQEKLPNTSLFGAKEKHTSETITPNTVTPRNKIQSQGNECVTKSKNSTSWTAPARKETFDRFFGK